MEERQKIPSGKDGESRRATEKRPAVLAAITYASIALAAAGLFLAITLAGRYTWIARAGGAAWVFILALIILMPPVISYYKRTRT